MYENPEQIRKVNPGEMQTIMPWAMHAGRNTTDLAAIIDCLQSLKPVENRVTKFLAREDS